MIHRRPTRTVRAGSVRIGSRHPVVIQSMTRTATTDVGRTVAQVKRLAAAGCGLVRLAVPRRADTAAFAKIVGRVPVGLVADVHFSADRAVEAVEAGAAKIRINPGNIKRRDLLLRIIDSAKMHSTAVRIGVNEASIRDLRAGDVPPEKRVALMVSEMKKFVRIFEKRGFDRLVLSAKSSDTGRTILASRALARAFDWPLHLGVTHAGLPEDAVVCSAVAIGSLLADGIGDTIRVSAAGSPLAEVDAAKRILASLGLYGGGGPTLVVCPVCGRAESDVIRLARRVRKALAAESRPLRIAVMGCVVNGPGEAADADAAVCAAGKKAFIYRRGRRVATVPYEKAAEALLEQIAMVRGAGGGGS
jgi:(E)-4-hydroxy-3-methylbut-2-enyl-diphosphate synthase